MDPTRVLIVDDNQSAIDLAAFALNAAGYQVESACDAGQALLKIPVFQPTLILMDVQMPGVDGIELTRQLKADPATWTIQILAFTAFARQGDAQTLHDARFDGYIGKPLDVMTLAAEVRFWMEAPNPTRASHFVWP